MTTPANDLIALMQEFGVKVQMLGTDDAPDPASKAMCAMLTEIHEHRTRIAAERVPAIPEGWKWVWMQVIYDPTKPDGQNERCEVKLDRVLHTWARVSGHGPTWNDALTAAIDAARDGDQ